MAEHIRVVIEGDADDLARAARQAVRDLGMVTAAEKASNQETKRSTRSNDDATRSLRRMGDESRRAATASRGLGVSLAGVGWTAAIVGIGPLTAGLIDLAPAAAGAAGAIAPLGGALGALPGALIGIGQAGLVAKLAFQGMDKALAGNEKALKKLTPAAQEFVKTVRGELRPAVQGLQKEAQAGLFPGLEKGVKAALPLLKTLSPLVKETSRSMGDVAHRFGEFLGSKAFNRDLGTIASHNAHNIRTLGDAGLHWAKAIMNIAAVAQPMLDDFTRLTDHVAKSADAFFRHARASGQLREFFDLVQTRVHQFMGLFGNLSKLIFNILRAAQPLANDLMNWLVKATGHLADITATLSGQNKLKSFFEEAKAPLAAVGRLFGDLVKDLFDIGRHAQGPLTQLAEVLRQKVLPPLHDAINFLTGLLPSVLPVLGSIGDAFGAIVHAIEPWKGTLKDVLRLIKDILDALLGIVKALPDVAQLPAILAVAAGGFGLAGKGPLGGALGSVFGGAAGGAAGAAAKGAGGAGGEALLAGLLGGGAGGLVRGAGSLIGRAMPFAVPLGLFEMARAAAPHEGQFGIETTPGTLGQLTRGITQGPGDILKGHVGKGLGELLIGAAPDKGRQAVEKFGDAVKKLGGDLAAVDTGTLTKMADQAKRLADRFPDAAKGLIDFANAAQAQVNDRIGPIFAQMASDAGKHLKTIHDDVYSNMVAIETEMGSKSAAAKDALVHNFQLAIGDIRQSMHDGIVSVRSGMDEIRRITEQEMQLYGVSKKGAHDYAAMTAYFAAHPGTTNPSGRAGGGYIGAPGEAGTDQIPVVVGRGEAILNRHQQAVVNQGLAAIGIGGLGDLFTRVRTPHFMAAGGVAGGQPIRVQTTVGGELGAVVQGALDKVAGAAENAADRLGAVAATGTGHVGHAAAANMQLGRRMMLAAGWGAEQWPSLRGLWMGESGWSDTAVNKASGAAGIPQALGHGHVFDLGDARAQIAWGLSYIKSRYGSPGAAYAAWLGRSPHWYTRGGVAHAASGLLGDLLSPDTPDKSAKKKAAKAKLPFFGGTGRPDVRHVHGNAKPDQPLRPKISKWLLGLVEPEDRDVVGDVGFAGILNTIEDQISAQASALNFYVGRPTYNDPNLTDAQLKAQIAGELWFHTNPLHTGIEDLYVAELGALSGPTGAVSVLGATEGKRKGTLAQLQEAWTHAHQLAVNETKSIERWTTGRGTWERRVADNEERIRQTRLWLARMTAARVGHRATKTLSKTMANARLDISRWEAQNSTLRETQPPPRGVSAHALAVDRRHLAQQQADMEFIAGSADAWTAHGGLAADYSADVGDLDRALHEARDKVTQLVRDLIPGEINAVDALKAQGAKAPTVDTSAQIAALQEQLAQTRKALTITQEEGHAFANFAPMLLGRMVGAFAHGGVVGRTGTALVHEGEVVLPAPDGPYGSTLNRGAQAAPTSVEIHMHGGLDGVVDRIQAKVAGRVERMVSENLGRRSRLISTGRF